VRRRLIDDKPSSISPSPRNKHSNETSLQADAMAQGDARVNVRARARAALCVAHTLCAAKTLGLRIRTRGQNVVWGGCVCATLSLTKPKRSATRGGNNTTHCANGTKNSLKHVLEVMGARECRVKESKHHAPPFHHTSRHHQSSSALVARVHVRA
jgi:hypothetical protein